MDTGSKINVRSRNLFLFSNDFFKVFAFTLSYFLASVLSFLFPDSQHLLMLIWPAGGIGLAAFLLNPKRIWPIITLTLFISGMVADVFIANRSFLASFGYMTGNILESTICAWFILYLSEDFQKFSRVKEILALLVAAGIINAFTACIGAGTSAFVHNANFWHEWISWFIADGLGILLVAPFIVSWAGKDIDLISEKNLVRIIERIVFVIILCTVSYFIFYNALKKDIVGIHPYMLVALFAWPSIRFKQSGVTFALLLLYSVSIFSPSIMYGPSPWNGIENNFTHRILELQLFLGFLAVVSYLLAAGYTNLKSAQNTIIKSEEKYRVSIETAMDGFWLANEEGWLLQVNDSYCKMIGYSKEELLRMHISDLDVKENFSETIEHMKNIKLLGEDRFESKQRHKNGNVVDFEISVQYRLIDGGRFVVFLRDITDRKNVEEQLRESENRFSLFMDHQPALVFIKDSESRALYVNNSMNEALGASKWIGLKPSEVFDKETAERMLGDDNDAMKKGYKKIEESFPNLDGKVHHYETQKFVIPRPGKEDLLGGIAIDITERKKVEQALRENQEKFEKIFNNAPVLISISDLETGVFIDVNNSAEIVSGYKHDEIIGHSSRELNWITTENRERLITELQKNGRVTNLEMDFRRKDGNKIIGLVSAEPITILNRQCLLTAWIDLTEQKLAQKAMNESEKKYREMIANLRVGFYSISMEGKFLDHNDEFIKMVNLPPNTNLIGQKALKFWESEEERSNYVQELLSKGFVDNYLVRGKKNTGEKTFIELNARLVKDEAGKPQRIEGTAYDITERQRAEQILKESEEKFRLLFENSPLGISITSIEGKIINLNRAMSEILGSPSIELSKQINVLTFPNLVANGYTNEFMKCVDEKKIIVKELFYTSNWGKNLYVSVYLVPSLDSEGNITQVYTLVEDITQRKLVENQLGEYQNHLEELVKQRTDEWDAANEELKIQLRRRQEYEMMLQNSLEKEKELNEIKTRFISTTSHEFRTPLTTVLSSSELLQRYMHNWNDDRKNEHFARIKNSVYYLTKLLDDILLINRSESGEMILEPSKFDLFQFADEMVYNTKSLINGNHKLRVEYKTEQKEYFLDRKLMSFILNNLLSNAVKYSPEGGTITLTINSDDKCLSIEVKDSGIGIPPNELGKIFDSFYRAKNVENISGNGLGLAIVKRAVELHRGEIKVSSAIGKGTTFLIDIPIELSV